MNGNYYKVITEKEAAELMMIWGALRDMAENTKIVKLPQKELKKLDERFEAILLKPTGNVEKGTN